MHALCSQPDVAGCNFVATLVARMFGLPVMYLGCCCSAASAPVDVRTTSTQVRGTVRPETGCRVVLCRDVLTNAIQHELTHLPSMVCSLGFLLACH